MLSKAMIDAATDKKKVQNVWHKVANTFNF